MNLLTRNNLPFIILLGVLLTLPFAHVKNMIFDTPFYGAEIVLIIFFILKFLSQFFVVEKKKKFLPDRLFLFGATLFLLGALVAFFMNPFSTRGLGMLKSWFFFPWLFGLFIFLEAQQHERRELFLKVWGVVMGATALASLMLFFTGAVTYDHRLLGAYDSPNFLAIFIAPAGLLFLHFLFSETKKSFFEKIFLFSGGSVVFITVLLTHSYGTWLALFCSASLFLFGLSRLSGKRKRFLIPLLVFLVILFGVFSFERGSEKWQALSSLEERSSLASRMMIWQAASRIASDHPLFGIGVGRFQIEYLSYQAFFPPYLEWAVPEPHNIILAVLLSTGLMGLFGFLLMLGRFLILARRVFVRGEEEKKREALLFASLLTLFLVYGLTDTPYFANDLSYTFVLVLSLGFASFAQEKTLREEGSQSSIL